jgi:hypothetical protein
MNLAPVNYSFYPSLYSSNVGQSLGHGQGGTVCNTIAAEGKYVDTVGRLEPSIQGKQTGGDGYGFTGVSPGKIIGPDAGYLGIDKYSTSSMAVARPGNIVGHFKGGRRKHTYKKHTHRRHKFRQIGCRRSHKRSSHKRSSHNHRHKRSHKKGTPGGKRSRHRRRSHKGGSGQPYSNIPISFGQSFDSKLSAYDSALANPVPLTPYSRCDIVPRV